MSTFDSKKIIIGLNITGSSMEQRISANDVKKILEVTDVFGYPLNKNHYGTGELVILEAMYSKIPVVTFSRL